MNKILLIIGLLSLTFHVWGQNDARFSLFYNNRNLLNPAASNPDQQFSVSLSAKEQWTGFDDAPATQAVYAGYYAENLHSGISISLLNDQLGAESLQNIKLRYSFHAWLSDKSYLAFGLGAGMVMRSFNSANLVVDEPDDPHVSQADIVENRFDVDFGMEFRFKGFFTGGVINHLTQSYKPLDIHRTPRHLLVYSGWEVNVSYDFMLVPVVAFSAADHVYQWEGGLRTGFKERYWLGLAYRLHDAIVLSARTGITENLFIAYAYDMAVGKLQTYKNGSHEIGIQFHIPQPQKRFKSPRFFD